MKVFLAYIDPGLGQLAWQALVAAFLGCIFYLKKTRTWLVNTIGRLFRSEKRPTQVPTPAPVQVSRAEPRQ